MPIPLYTEPTKNSENATESQPAAQASTGSENNQSSHGISTNSGSTSFYGYPPALNNEGRVLSREEADRLYEERMEEEYAKREGGA